MSSTPIRPWFNASRVTVPTGAVVPDLTVKRSIVLDQWRSKRVAQRGAAVQADRLRQQQRAYDGAGVNRLTGDWTALNTSADSELLTSLRVLRARSRQLVRDNPYAKHAVRVIVNNVIGGGIGLQAAVVNARRRLVEPTNTAIEQAWEKWAKKATCHTAGLLGFADIERLVMAQLVVAGEAIVRKVRQPFGGGRIPLALEVIEADRLMDQWQTARAPNGNAIRMGIEVDEWGRPVAYWFTPNHPGDYQFTTFQPSKFLRVPASDIIHLYLVDRWPMTRGEPWFHSVLRTLHDASGYEEAVVVKARASANVVGFIKSTEQLGADEIDKLGRQLVDTEPGTWQKLLPGEDVAGFNTATPDPAVEPFLRLMIRKFTIGVGISYEAGSRDYSQSNYSGSRMGLLDDRDNYRVLQGWICRNLRDDIHREFLDAAVLVGELKLGADYYTNTDKYLAKRYKPRGWTWIDPSKEVAAYKMAVRCGFMTQGDVIAQTGNGADLEDVLTARADEIETAEELGLVFDTNPAQVNDKGAPATTAASGGAPPGEEEPPDGSAGAGTEAEPGEAEQEEAADA